MNGLRYDVPTVLPLKRFADDRGFLEALFEGEAGSAVCIKRTFSSLGVVRGFHWQRDPSPQTKLIYALRGAIVDATVRIENARPNPRDMRIVKLTEEEPACLFVPADYAHAYQTVSKDSIVLYVCFGAYDAAAEVSFNPLKLGVNWPVSPAVVSKKDLDGG